MGTVGERETIWFCHGGLKGAGGVPMWQGLGCVLGGRWRALVEEGRAFFEHLASWVVPDPVIHTISHNRPHGFAMCRETGPGTARLAGHALNVGPPSSRWGLGKGRDPLACARGSVRV